MFLITGANGQLGKCLQDILPADKLVLTDVAELDITNEKTVLDFGQHRLLTAIINCAAYTNVDKAESEPELARKINAEGPANLAKLAATKNIPLIHISTDYVFDGMGHIPITEEAPVHPLAGNVTVFVPITALMAELVSLISLAPNWSPCWV